MKDLAVSIVLLSIIAWNTGCGLTDIVAKTSVNFNQGNQKITSSVGNANDGKRENRIELQLSVKETICIKSQSCKVFLDIQNVSKQDVEIGGLLFWVKPFSEGSRRDFSNDMTSVIDLETLENLSPNESGNHLTIMENEHIEKEIDIEQIKWKIAKLSSWEHDDLWKHITEGKYQINVGVGQFPKISDAPRKEKIGNVEVEIINTYPAKSNWLTLDFKKK